MSSLYFCLTSKDFLMCPKAFILGIFKGVRINPRKNIHFSDKVGVGGSSPLIPTKSRHLAKAKCFSFSRNELQIFANEFWRKEKAILHLCKMQGFVNMMARTTFLKDPSSYIKRQRDISELLPRKR